MSANDEHSVHGEPHRQGGGHEPDPTEERAERALQREANAPQASYRDGESIYDEPDILPGRVGETVEQDWSCSSCGYNLRGLPLEKGCPECGHREWYRPPPKEESSYATWLERRRAAITSASGWRWAFGLAAGGGFFAVVSAFIKSSPPGIAAMNMWLMVIVFGPVVEETMKIAAASLVVETRPYRFTQVEQIQVAAIGSAACFALIENLLYLHVYIANPSMTLILWRWVVCTLLHIGCTAIATRGLIDVWRHVQTEQRPPRIGQAVPALITAILVHGCYNAGVMGYESIFGPM